VLFKPVKDRKWRKENISSKLSFASEKIAKARFKIYGKDALLC
jgi:hypothetical protein